MNMPRVTASKKPAASVQRLIARFSRSLPFINRRSQALAIFDNGGMRVVSIIRPAISQRRANVTIDRMFTPSRCFNGDSPSLF
jgi:hypothetical protein